MSRPQHDIAAVGGHHPDSGYRVQFVQSGHAAAVTLPTTVLMSSIRVGRTLDWTVCRPRLRGDVVCRALGVADEDHVLGAGGVLALGQLVELGGVDRGLLEVEVLQALAVREAGLLEAPLRAPLAAVVELHLEEVGQVVTVRHALAGGLLGELTVVGGHGGQAELSGLGLNEGRRRPRAAASSRAASFECDGGRRVIVIGGVLQLVVGIELGLRTFVHIEPAHVLQHHDVARPSRARRTRTATARPS
jgi:hypothetical protein